MATVTIRDLSRNAGEVIDQVEKTGRPALVTRRRRLVAALIPVDLEQLEDYLLASAPDLIAGRSAADDELARGATRSLAEVLSELEAE